MLKNAKSTTGFHKFLDHNIISDANMWFFLSYTFNMKALLVLLYLLLLILSTYLFHREGTPLDKVKEAHRRVMVANHPDAGGSHYLASKINEAKDMMLGKIKSGGSAF